MSQAAIHARNRLGGTIRLKPNDREALAAARLELRAAKLEDYIVRTVEQAPPLTDEQRARLAAILAPGTGGDT
jgi:hypothetical protein